MAESDFLAHLAWNFMQIKLQRMKRKCTTKWKLPRSPFRRNQQVFPRCRGPNLGQCCHSLPNSFQSDGTSSEQHLWRRKFARNSSGACITDETSQNQAVAQPNDEHCNERTIKEHWWKKIKWKEFMTVNAKVKNKQPDSLMTTEGCWTSWGCEITRETRACFTFL